MSYGIGGTLLEEEHLTGELVSLDAQHVKILDLTARLINRLTGEDIKGDREALIETFLSYAAFHLDFEEELMRVAGYPGLEDHARTHHRLIDQWRLSLARRAGPFPRHTLHDPEALIAWLTLHIASGNRKFREFLDSPQRARAVLSPVPASPLSHAPRTL